jgi:HPt (histidine-containing phosphotransfer) domain-containing protein
MYYILNQSGQIVAVDTELLSQLSLNDVDELYKKISLNELSVNLEEGTVSITEHGNTRTFKAKENPLSGLLGDFTLVAIDADSETASTEMLILDEDIIYDTQESETAKKDTSDTLDEEVLSLDDALFELKDDSIAEDPVEAENSVETLIQTDTSNESIEDELFDLLIPSDADNAIAKIKEEDVDESLTENETTPIYIDIDTISQKIGISPDDYNLFLDEYIDTALALEEALQGSDEEEQANALHKLSHLSNVLHLPYVEETLKEIENAKESSQRHLYLTSFFNTLGRLTTSRFEEEKTDSEEEAKTEIPAETVETKPSIDLSDVKPIYFDFQLDEAAKDLSLPVELIEEFVNEFIIQAHEETDKMLAAYEKGDLETIQKIGHLLKGTSSNLRITPLSETLYMIQFNEDINKVPELVKNYWGHFLAFENQIKLISKGNKQ